MHSSIRTTFGNVHVLKALSLEGKTFSRVGMLRRRLLAGAGKLPRSGGASRP